MADTPAIPMMDHQLAEDELAWIAAVRRDFKVGLASGGDPRDVLRGVLSKPEHQLPTPIDLTGDGVWRGGRNAHGRLVAGVFLKTVELHTHIASRTDQWPLFVRGEAENFAITPNGDAILTPITGDDHYHNPPGAPHAFVPKTGQPVPDHWEIAFIAITPRNLAEDTHRVDDATRTEYERATGRPAPTRV